MDSWITEYRQFLESRRLAPSTIKQEMQRLDRFVYWLDYRDLRDIVRADWEAFYEHMSRPYERSPRKTPPDIRYRQSHLLAVKRFYVWLKLHEKILLDPFADTPKFKKQKRLPRNLINAGQANRILAQPKLDKLEGLRDRAMLELLYSSGLRGFELCNLTLHDIDFEQKLIRVIQGKGRKDRFVPLGKMAAGYLRVYLDQARPDLIRRGRTPGVQLWIGSHGAPLKTATLRSLVRRYAKAAEVINAGTHSFRHACATEMLRGGASVRHVQEMLGHAEIATTQIYTRVVATDLQKVHARTSPSERRKKSDAPEFEWRASAHDPRQPLAHKPRRKGLRRLGRKFASQPAAKPPQTPVIGFGHRLL